MMNETVNKCGSQVNDGLTQDKGSLNWLPQPVKPFFPETEEKRENIELWRTICDIVHMCGYKGDDVTAKSIEILKRIGRFDMVPPCERG